MNTKHDPSTSELDLPSGFLTIRLDQLLLMLAMTIALAWQAARHPTSALYILAPLMVVFMVSALVARRGMRRFVREHGAFTIVTTYAPETDRGGKSVFLRETGQVIDDAIDNVMDGRH